MTCSTILQDSDSFRRDIEVLSRVLAAATFSPIFLPYSYGFVSTEQDVLEPRRLPSDSERSSGTNSHDCTYLKETQPQRLPTHIVDWRLEMYVDRISQ